VNAPVILRPAIFADAAGIAAVHVAARRAAYGAFLPAAELARGGEVAWTGQWQEWLVGARAARRYCLVADDRSRDSGAGIIGFVAGGPVRARVEPWEGDVAPYSAEVYSIYVRPERQGEGHGRRLLTRFAAWLEAAGHSGLILWAYRDNPHSRFYEHLGAVKVATSRWVVEGAAFPTIGYAWADLAALSAAPAKAAPPVSPSAPAR
jgi:GNAT superfamily N-acetyltransferase